MSAGRFFIEFAYNGIPFHGWQRQPNAISVQQTMEDALATLFRQRVELTGAGRTDTGVHARKMYAHFDAPHDFSPRTVVASLGKLCGKDISIASIHKVTPDAHARFDATSRTYKYFVTHSTSCFTRALSWYCPQRLDYDAMNKAAAIIRQAEDFTSFAKLHSDAKTNICRIDEAYWAPETDTFNPDDNFHVFTIKADRFLRNMVRAIVGTLVDIGRGKMKPCDICSIIEAKDRCAAGTSMPPYALFLWDIQYPDNIFL